MRLSLLILFSLIITSTITAMLIDYHGQQMPAHKNSDAIIVAGCRVQSDGTPSLALQYRTDHAVHLYKEGYADKIIFTGGSPDNRVTEASAAKQYALQQYDIPGDALLIEEISTNTEENARLTAQLYPELTEIILVSDSYHLFRAERVFDNYFTKVHPSGRVPAYNVRIPGALRELIAIPYYYMQGRL